jgi:hypothetical protein
MTATLDDPIITSLDAFASLPAWLAAGMLPDRVRESLTAHVPELASGAVQLVAVTPQRLRAKGSEWLARYLVTLAVPGGGTREVVLVGDLEAPATDAPEALSTVPTSAGSSGPAFGEAGWKCWLPDLRLRLQVQTADEALPALPSITDPAAVRRLIQSVLRETGYREAVVASCRPEVVRYKPGSRCTVVVRLSYEGAAAGPDPVVVKTHQGDKGKVAWEAMQALWSTPLRSGAEVVLAEPLAFLPQDRVLVQGPVPGSRTLKELARDAIHDGGPEALGSLRAELARTARALAALHGCGARYGSVATFDDELAEVRDVVDRLGASIPTLPAAARPLLERLAERSRVAPADGVVCAHHDFRPAQVMLDDGRVGFIDFDGSGMAEPALDLGRFRAKLRDIGISALVGSGQPLAGAPVARNLALLDELCEHFLDAYLAHAPVSRDRVVLWEVCDLLTAMLHAWTKVRLARIDPRLTVLVHRLRSISTVPSG